MSKKMIKKSKCSFEQGRIVRKGRVVGIEDNVGWQMERLEIMLQQHDYLISQPKGHPMPTLEGFKRQHADIGVVGYHLAAPDTPTADARFDEAERFLAEMDAVNETAECNKAIDRFAELIQWAASPKFMEGGFTGPFDLHILGNPLDMTPDGLVALIFQLARSGYLGEDADHILPCRYSIGLMQEGGCDGDAHRTSYSYRDMVRKGLV